MAGLAYANHAIERGNQTPRFRVEIAAIHAVRQEHDAALTWIQSAYDSGFRDYRMLSLHPAFEALRNEPRFVGFVDRMTADVAAMRQRVDLTHTLPQIPIPNVVGAPAAAAR